MTLVFDATPLIYLGKADRLDVFEEIERSLLLPNQVHEEVVYRGMKKGYPDAKRINESVRNGPLEQQEVERTERFDRLASETNLSQADTAVLLLADEVNGTAVMDESYGRNIADTEGIETRGTASLLLSLVKRERLDPDEARETIDAMLGAGWHCSTDLYAKILRKLEEVAPE